MLDLADATPKIDFKNWLELMLYIPSVVPVEAKDQDLKNICEEIPAILPNQCFLNPLPY